MKRTCSHHYRFVVYTSNLQNTLPIVTPHSCLYLYNSVRKQLLGLYLLILVHNQSKGPHLYIEIWTPFRSCKHYHEMLWVCALVAYGHIGGFRAATLPRQETHMAEELCHSRVSVRILPGKCPGLEPPLLWYTNPQWCTSTGHPYIGVACTFNNVETAASLSTYLANKPHGSHGDCIPQLQSWEG